MNRRRFLRLSGAGFAIATGSLAGCLGGNERPPPRKADVFEDVSIDNGTMELSLLSEPKVESDVDNVDEAAIVGALLPIGTARAGSRSSSGSGVSGATGRGTGGYSSAPKDSRHGWAIYGGYEDDDWREEHADDLKMYQATVATLGIAYLGSNMEYQQDPPGPGPVAWDKEWTDVEPGETLEVDLGAVSPDSQFGSDTSTASGNESGGDGGSGSDADSRASEGWYRVGSHLESPDGSTDFNWQAVDFKLERASTGELTVDEAWHVRPRL